jgi:hypothetical protein
VFDVMINKSTLHECVVLVPFHIVKIWLPGYDFKYTRTDLPTLVLESTERSLCDFTKTSFFSQYGSYPYDYPSYVKDDYYQRFVVAYSFQIKQGAPFILVNQTKDNNLGCTIEELIDPIKRTSLRLLYRATDQKMDQVQLYYDYFVPKFAPIDFHMEIPTFRPTKKVFPVYFPLSEGTKEYVKEKLKKVSVEFYCIFQPTKQFRALHCFFVSV